MRGPVGFSTVGMRIQNEQSGSSSLFAQPMALEPIPEAGGQESAVSGGQAGDVSDGRSLGASSAATKVARTMLEARMESVLTDLAAEGGPPSATTRQGHLALLKRWYYRPEVKRVGEIFFPDAEERWPVKAMLRGVGRVAAKMLAHAERT